MMKNTIRIELMRLRNDLLIQKTKGEKEKELEDLELIIKRAKNEYGIDTIVTGALHSVYQASRIQKICDKLNLKCFNPLWHKDEIKYLHELVKEEFKVVIVGVFAYPLTNQWLGRIIDDKFINEVKQLKEKYKIHPAGEGGEFETFVVNCPLFKRELKVTKHEAKGKGNSWKLDIKVE